VDENWRIWTPEEVASVMAQTRGGDCGRFDTPGIDRWGKQINIAVRKRDRYTDIVMWSNGPDGVTSTTDDLVMPYGGEVPKK
jgi:hypothetical protein